MTMVQNDVVMVLGTNANSRRNMEKAMAALREIMPDIVFTESAVTKPVDMVSGDFLNCMAKATTWETLERLEKAVKGIERMLGDDRHDTNVVNMDIDILQYGTRRLRPEDWNRDYIRMLYIKLQEPRTL